jgi:hypothetical protein
VLIQSIKIAWLQQQTESKEFDNVQTLNPELFESFIHITSYCFSGVLVGLHLNKDFKI